MALALQRQFLDWRLTRFGKKLLIYIYIYIDIYIDIYAQEPQKPYLKFASLKLHSPRKTGIFLKKHNIFDMIDLDTGIGIKHVLVHSMS